MPLKRKVRKSWALVVLLLGLPIYVIVCVNIIGLFDRPPILLELVIYVVLGFVWAFPFKFLFLGVGKSDNDI